MCPRPIPCASLGLQQAQILCARLTGLAILPQLKSKPHALLELNSASLTRRHVNENVVPALVRLDEAEALVD